MRGKAGFELLTRPPCQSGSARRLSRHDLRFATWSARRHSSEQNTGFRPARLASALKGCWHVLQIRCARAASRSAAFCPFHASRVRLRSMVRQASEQNREGRPFVTGWLKVAPHVLQGRERGLALIAAPPDREPWAGKAAGIPSAARHRAA